MNAIPLLINSYLLILIGLGLHTNLLANSAFLDNLDKPIAPPTDTSFACNDLVQVSLDNNCQAFIYADLIVEGYSGDFNDFSVIVTENNGDTISNPVSGSFIGEILTVQAFHLPSGIYCWGQIFVEDKLPPQITCNNYTIQCFQSPNAFPLPLADDNCDPNPDINLINEVVDEDDICNAVTITRMFNAIDNQGNISGTCSQVYTTTLPPLPDFPQDTAWACQVYNAHPNVTNATKLTGNLNTTGSGVPNVAVGNYCPYNVTSHTDTLDGCGQTFSLVRIWTVLNWCTGQIYTTDINGDDNVQIIKVLDKTPPVFTKAAFTVAANISGNYPGGCAAVNFIGPAVLNDNCHASSQRIFTPIGELDYINGLNGADGGIIPFPGLPIGVHIIKYLATDICGNTDSLLVPMTVADQTAPIATCDEITSISLNNIGQADALASVFDDGSHDNCCLDTLLVRRMTAPCNSSDLAFHDRVHFCCQDVNQPVTVVFRAVDCAGNYNDCMVTVQVEDKLPPTLVSCPPNATMTCEDYVSQFDIPLALGQFSVLNQFGLPEFQDNCQLIYLDSSTVVNLDQCMQGAITRNWKVTDPGNNGQTTCQQQIFVNHRSFWAVEFPADITVNCTDELPDSGTPALFFEDCELIAVSHEDEVFNVVPDACYKIVRTWNVINWCAVGATADDDLVESHEAQLNFDLNGDGEKNNRTFQDGINLNNFNPQAPNLGAQPDGFISYQQVIKVIDNVDPVVTCPAVFDVCIESTECFASFSLPAIAVTDCSESITINASGALGQGLGTFTNIAPGDYPMTYHVSDNCNNATACQTLVRVKDCKNPTPYCIGGLNLTLGQDTTVTIDADDFDAGSFDNCGGALTFSFSPNINTTNQTFDCNNIGLTTIEIWVTDASGNQDFCETIVYVDDNLGVCQGPPLIAGAARTELEQAVNLVAINLNGSMQNSLVTGPDGQYSFEVAINGDYTVSALKNTLPLNGVTTFDLVQVSKHILGIQGLDSPYKIIAADVNRSNSVTTADLVAIRKLILQIENEFPNNTSWRFVDKNYVFPDPNNPFGEPFPEVLNFNNISDDQLGANFVAIKIGDVNGSADPQL